MHGRIALSVSTDNNARSHAEHNAHPPGPAARIVEHAAMGRAAADVDGVRRAHPARPGAGEPGFASGAAGGPHAWLPAAARAAPLRLRPGERDVALLHRRRHRARRSLLRYL